MRNPEFINVDTSTIVHWIITTLGGLVMYFMNKSNSALEDRIYMQNQSIIELQKELKTTQLTYLQKNDFTEFKKELFDRLDRLETFMRKA